MKKIFFLAASLVMLLTSCGNSTSTSGDKDTKQTVYSTQVFNFDTTALAAGAKFYQCPMDLEVISDKPGTCPKCDMELVEVTKQ
jgi:hypothetical protein